MTILSVLFLGLVMGMRHAIESDHVAAVASLVARDIRGKSIWKLGTIWGGGHALALFSVGFLFLLIDWDAPEIFSQWLELVVGLMLVILGIDLIRRVITARIHLHVHRHDEKKLHFHAHAHMGTKDNKTKHVKDIHPHNHGATLSLGTFLIGMVHGTAGSATLVLLVLGTIQSFWLGVGYILLFGIGSIIGMAVFSATITMPLRLSARFMTVAFNGLQGSIGVWTIIIGSLMINEQANMLIG